MTQQQREQMVLENMPLVTYIARKYKHLLAIDELQQYGVIGLLKAIDGFDPTRNIKFVTYAYPRINGEIMKGIAESTHFMALEHHLANDLVKAENFIMDFKRAANREPTLEEMQSVLKFSKEKIINLRNLLSPPCYLDEEIDSPSSANGKKVTYLSLLKSEVQNPQEELEQKNLLQKLENILATLPYRNQAIVKMFFGLGVQKVTQEKIAREYNVSQKNISAVIKRALKKLKLQAEKHDLKEFLA